MQLSTTTASTTMINASRICSCGAGFSLCMLASAALLTACGAKPVAASDVDLRLTSGTAALVLTVENRSVESLDLPADLVNGPRSVARSVFLEVRDQRGTDLKRCAIVEIEPERMRDVRVLPGEKKVFDIPLQTLAATYCAQTMKVAAVYGSLAHDDRLLPIAVSNEIDVQLRAKGDGGN